MDTCFSPQFSFASDKIFMCAFLGWLPPDFTSTYNPASFSDSTGHFVTLVSSAVRRRAEAVGDSAVRSEIDSDSNPAATIDFLS